MGDCKNLVVLKTKEPAGHISDAKVKVYCNLAAGRRILLWLWK